MPKTLLRAEAPDAERDVPPLGRILEFLRVLWSVDHGLNRMSKRMEAELGVTGPQRLTLRFIGRFPGISAGRLARILHMHPSTLTGILHRLELRRLLTRRSDPSDGRRALFGLTSKGKKLDSEHEGTIESILEQVLAQSSREQIALTADLLSRLARALEPQLPDEPDE